MKSLSPLRYPGGKAKIYNVILRLFNSNNIVDPIYIEGFAGGSGLALLLLKNHIVKKLILNDIDKGIYSFWYSVLNYTSEFCDLIRDVPISLEERVLQKEIYKSKDTIFLEEKEQMLKLALATFYLNRVNRSGILKGGVIGGNLQEGKYKMDCRFNKKNLILKIKEIAGMKDRIEFYNMDILDFKKSVIDNIDEEKFIFFDPPYYQKGPELYTNFYKHTNHFELFEEIKTLNQHWIVTYDNCEQIKNMYSTFKSKEFNIKYSLNNKKVAEEVMFFSNSITNIDIF
ncbi:hypothetical protein A2U11_10095 [Fusobacterium necrophorum subsp. funduliforme]|uniref:DNA adenine methylase n=1 Tax=Fusobacterium necrophorum TaxID=859 RepID=UPI000789A564|nr:DNA adenine methylase [Fusobacterium necrophorum]KYM49764.1 hypothetical protein A2U11_10095 [Fusobacterium necrophorum subsp. funduliforme]